MTKITLKVIGEPIFDLLFRWSFFKNKQWLFMKKIGKGSFGTAYLIKDPSENRLYILKRMNYHKLNSAEAKEGFTIEGQLLSELADHAFPALIEKGKWKGTPYMVMEYKNGKTFEQLIFSEDKVFTEQEAFIISARILAKVTELHKKGIIHRDLRIPNILTNGIDMFIIDFGLARKADHSPDDTGNGDPRKPIHFTSDLYAIGHFLLFLLYSGYTPVAKNERAWDEELTIHPDSIRIIKKLLMSDLPFDSSDQALTEIKKHIKTQWE
ncbi:serine/threonine protein kinase [Bacillus sp. V59.32b]|nr:serine/threonine protein kinase [Bacillus sp. V59.32b]